MNLQALVDAIGRSARDTRAQYQMTLGKAIDALSKMPGDLPVVIASDFPHYSGMAPGRLISYRGYYSDLAIAPRDEDNGGVTVANFLADLRAANGKTFTGYKGGDFTMDDGTVLWVSSYGTSSALAVMSFTRVDDAVAIVTKIIE